MSPDDPRHGTTAGYQAHRRDSAPPCAECRRAAADYERKRSNDRYLNRPRRVPSVGVERRVRALQAIGWSMDLIAAEGGWKDRDSIWYFVRGDSVTCTRRTAERIEAVYRKLSMTPGPSRITAIRAEKAGWPPPLAWDDIDNPDERPTLGEPDQRAGNGGRSVATLIEDAEWLADGDATLTEVIERLSVNRDTFRETCTRAGRSDLYWRLARREPDGEQRWATREGIRRSKEVA